MDKKHKYEDNLKDKYLHFKRDTELSQNEKKYQLIFENINDAVFVHELTPDGMPGKFIAVNREARERMGYSLEEFLSMSPADLDAKESRKNIPGTMEQFHKKGYITFEATHQTKDGQKIPVEISSTIISFREIKIIISVARDISRRKKDEKIIANSEKKYRTIFESSPDANVLFNQKGEVIELNGRMTEWLGYSNKQIIGKKLDELPFFDEQNKQKVVKNFHRRMAGENVQPYELDFIASNGEHKIGLIKATLLGDEIAGDIHDLVMISDITREMRTIKKLSKSEKRNSLIVKIMHKIGATFDLEKIYKIIAKELLQEINCSGCAILSLQNDSSFKMTAAEGIMEKFENISFSPDTAAIESIIKERKCIYANTVSDKKEQLLKGCIPAGSNIQSLICVPVLVDDKVRSIIHLDSTEKNTFSDGDVQFVEFLAEIISFTIERVDLYYRIEEISIRDGLTGCFNRRKFDMNIIDEVNRAKRYQRDLSLLMIDIDWFKKYNDFHGHTNGDNILRQLVKLINKESRETDRLYRYGGEEFVIILPETEKLEAVEFANRLREKVEKKLFVGEELSQPKTDLTISIGVSSFPDNGKGIKQLIDAADKALYTAKKKGRNQVCAA
jgi:diguanylate cyclase (GGDEF)-like protein/PAS domain S-box-containing protein